MVNLRHLVTAATVCAAVLVTGCPLVQLFHNLAGPPLAVQLVANGFTKPLFVDAPPGDAQRLFVVEKDGKIWIVQDGAKNPAPFLDIDALVDSSEHERGLLGLAFHPDYATNGHFYITYTELDGTLALVRYTRSAGDAETANPASAKMILQIAQPTAIHQGGMIAFGPDGYLYFGTGDGGGANDPDNAAQRLDTLLGKMLRIDIDNGDPYAIPASNPFVNTANAMGEIWAYGLRNPWRWSFDAETGGLYIADVGQDHREELNFQSHASIGGENYGWKTAEGFACRGGDGACGAAAGLVPPILDFVHPEAKSITGGYVYRGSAIPGLQGTYIIGDFIRNRIWTLRYDGARVTQFRERTAELAPGNGLAIERISSFGQDANGELYICDYSDGEIYKLVPPAAANARSAIKR